MKKITIEDFDENGTDEAEMAEELRLRRALKRVRLEEAARSPSISKYQWLGYIFLLGLMLYFHDQLSDYILYIVIWLMVEIKTSSSAVHSRIDAILELDKLSSKSRNSEQTNRMEMDAKDSPASSSTNDSDT